MKYMGSKNRHAKHLLPIILSERTDGQCYVEPFVGGCNMIDKVEGWRIAGELNEYIAAMWAELEQGWVPPVIDKNEYKHIKDNKHKYSSCLVGWVGVCCSYSGKWFGGFAGKVMTAGGLRDYQAEAHRNVMAQVESIKGVMFFHSSYKDLDIPQRSIIYCDPPYANTTGYKDEFNHDSFWDWCRLKSSQGNNVFISEYGAPDDFVCVWEKTAKSSLSANGMAGGNKLSTERLFTIGSNK